MTIQDVMSADGCENRADEERDFGTYKNKSNEFLIGQSGATSSQDIVTNRQYFFLYRARVDAMAPGIVEKAKRTIDPNLERMSLVDLKPGKEAFVVGVVLKKMKYRQSVLYEFLDDDTLDRDVREGIGAQNLVSDADQLEFEDSQQKMRLVGNIDKAHFVTGNVIGVFGELERDDFLNVKQVVFPELAAQPEWPRLCVRDCYVLFISGIALHPGTRDQATRDALVRFSKWLSDEHMGEEGVTKSICRIVIAGESIRVTEEDIAQQSIGFLGLEDNFSDEAVGHIDEFLSHLLGGAPVDLMGGPNDPCSLLLPQKPMPRMLFPLASELGPCFSTVTNPYKFELNGINFLGTAGQNILDLKRLTKGLSTIDLMQQCLQRGHLFPTAPDTLDAWPLADRDPFVLRELPHVFFVGSQEKFASKWIDGGDGQEDKNRCLLVALPKFARSKQVVLLNLRNMACHKLDFTTS